MQVLAILIMATAPLAGCLGADDITEEVIEDIIDDVIDDNNTTSDETDFGLTFIFVKAINQTGDEHTPLSIHFSAPPMSDGSPYNMTLICSFAEGHTADVYSAPVTSSFNNITSWKIKNTYGIVLNMYAYSPMSDISAITTPYMVFDASTDTSSGHLNATIQDSYACVDAPEVVVIPDDCPFDDPINSPCVEPECIADHESAACLGLVDVFCADSDNADDEGCIFMAMLPVMNFIETIDMESDSLCGIVPEMGSRTEMTWPMMMEDGNMLMMTITSMWEYDDTGASQTKMWISSVAADNSVGEMGYHNVLAQGTDFPWISNLHMVISDEDTGEVTEYTVILRDMKGGPLDVCPEEDDEDDDDADGGPQSFWCSDEVGGSPDTEIPFSYVNDGYEDCGDGSDEPQDTDGDGVTDNWYDCNDGAGTTVSMEDVNDGFDDCPNGADEGSDDMGGEMDMDMGIPEPDDMGCMFGDDEDEYDDDSENGSDDEDEDDIMPTSATMETIGTTVYVNMTMEADGETCTMSIVAVPDSTGNMTMSSMTMSNGTASMAIEFWYDVTIDIVEEESADTDWVWAAADIVIMASDHSLHMFDCGDAGLVEEGDMMSSSSWILFNRVNDGIADCSDQSDEANDYDGDGITDTTFHCETPDNDTDDINMDLVNDGNMSDCANGSDEYMQTGSSYGTFNWDSTVPEPIGFSSMVGIFGFSDHNISTDELSLQILQTDSSTDMMTEHGQCAEMSASEKGTLTVQLNVGFDVMDTEDMTTVFTDTNGKNWNIMFMDNNENGFVDSGDGLYLKSSDTTDLYFTCLEIYDEHVSMHTGDTPNMMMMPGFTAVMVSLSLIGAALISSRRDDE
jgi:hypothetical protein